MEKVIAGGPVSVAGIEEAETSTYVKLSDTSAYSSYFWSLVISAVIPVPIDLSTNAQVNTRTAPGLIDLVVAFASGIIAAIALVREDIPTAIPHDRGPWHRRTAAHARVSGLVCADQRLDLLEDDLRADFYPADVDSSFHGANRDAHVAYTARSPILILYSSKTALGLT